MKWFREQHPGRIVVEIVAFLAAVITIVTAAVALMDDDESTGRKISENRPVKGVGTPDSSLQPDDASTTVEGMCRATSGEIVGCDSPHRVELFADGPCQTGGIVAYLGGDERDVLLRSVASVELDGRCGVRLPREFARLMEGALLEQDGDALRRCIDTRNSQEVSCDSVHTGEFVYEGDNTSRAACESRAAEYVGQPGSQILRFAEILHIQDDLNRRATCLLVARGDNQLMGSVRDLGSESWPITALQ